MTIKKVESQPVIETKRFHYDSASGRLSEEASTLFKGGGVPSRLFLKSSRTGEIRAFNLVTRHRDPEGDVVSYEYRPEDSGLALKVIIYND